MHGASRKYGASTRILPLWSGIATEACPVAPCQLCLPRGSGSLARHPLHRGLFPGILRACFSLCQHRKDGALVTEATHAMSLAFTAPPPGPGNVACSLDNAGGAHDAEDIDGVLLVAVEAERSVVSVGETKTTLRQQLR